LNRVAIDLRGVNYIEMALGEQPVENIAMVLRFKGRVLRKFPMSEATPGSIYHVNISRMGLEPNELAEMEVSIEHPDGSQVIPLQVRTIHPPPVIHLPRDFSDPLVRTLGISV